MNEEKIEKIREKMGELEWDSEVVPELMEGFHNSPEDVIDIDKCSENHLKDLWDILGCDEE